VMPKTITAARCSSKMAECHIETRTAAI
jgi:hypothetical protein